MREAPVVVKTCTFHFVNAKTDVAATTPIPVTLTDLPGGGFQITFAPTSTDESSNAYACDACATAILGKLEEQKDWIQSKIVDAVEEEENYIPEEETPEDSYELQGEPHDQGEEEEGEATPEAPAGELVGEKVVPPSPDRELMDRIIKSRVKDPKPEDVAPAVAAELEPWQAWFPEGYVPTKDAPKGAEKEACKAWFIGLPVKDKQQVAPRGWPERRMPDALIVAWHKSKEYAAEWFNKANV